MEKQQQTALAVLVIFALGTLVAGTGLVEIPRGPQWLPWLLHPLLLVAGLLCGGATVRRAREIDRVRWGLVEDDALTRGERLYAHREAERETRVAGSIFLLSGISMGAFAAYVLRIPEEIGVADLLILSPLFGFLAGLFVVSRRLPTPPGPGEAAGD